jgi:hypothetical protein
VWRYSKPPCAGPFRDGGFFRRGPFDGVLELGAHGAEQAEQVAPDQFIVFLRRRR